MSHDDERYGADDGQYHDNYRNPPALPRQQGMSGCMKAFVILSIVFGVLGTICCGGAMFLGWKAFDVFKNAFILDPVEIKKTAADIADVPIPDGMNPTMGINFGVFKSVIYSGPDGATLTISQVVAGQQGPAPGEIKQHQQQQQQDLVVVKEEEKEVTVKGEPRKFKFAQLKNNQTNVEYRRVSGSFPGKTGVVDLELTVPESAYNEEKTIEWLGKIK